MRVKVGNEWHDGGSEKIMVELNDNDKAAINEMAPECTRYAEFPNPYTDEIRLWISDGDPDRMASLPTPQELKEQKK